MGKKNEKGKKGHGNYPEKDIHGLGELELPGNDRASIPRKFGCVCLFIVKFKNSTKTCFRKDLSNMISFFYLSFFKLYIFILFIFYSVSITIKFISLTL